MEELLPDNSSDYAKEGSLAHEIAELKLRKQFIEPMGSRKFNSSLKKLQENTLYKEEMLKYTDTYMDYISQVVHSYASRPYVVVEKKLDYSKYAPDGFGTGDAIIIGGNTLYVIDLKYGQGVAVSATENPQMMLYALGAYEEYSLLYSITTVKMTVVQPRRDSISEYEMPIQALLEWGESIKPIAKKAFDGVGECVPGAYCSDGFCRAKAICRKRADFNLGLEQYKQMKPPLISNEEVGEILVRAQNLAAWAKNIAEYALSECLKGNDILGWKIVHGRGDRKFTNQDEAFKLLTTNGYDETMLYERKPLTLPAIETLLGKSKFNELLSEKIVQPPGKPTLVPLSDKRESITRVSAEDDFKKLGVIENECNC